MTVVMDDIEKEDSPLETIERRAQNRAKSEKLDVALVSAQKRLREILNDEAKQWSAEFRRGARTYDIGDIESLTERAFRDIAGYGPLQPLLDDPDVWEVMINAPNAIFVKRHKGQSGYHNENFHDDDHVIRTLSKLLDDATTAHRKFDTAEGLQDAQLDDGSRVHIVHQDIARGGHTIVNVRKFTGVAFQTIGQLVTSGMLDEHAAAVLRAFVKARMSIVFSGAPGSGKTTLLSCCASELDPRLRVVIAEEVFETDIALPNVAHMQTRSARNDRPEVDLRKLVGGFLRMAPDIAIVGEVRDREAMPLLLTLSSGVKGFTTIHSGSARQALTRLRFICQLSNKASELPISALNQLVSESVDVVVHCDRIDGAPKIMEIIAVEDSQTSLDATGFTTTSIFDRSTKDDPLRFTGNIPTRAALFLRSSGIDPERLFMHEDVLST
jgi:pilus assembly protein CpaF